jgi:hypothetical protein
MGLDVVRAGVDSGASAEGSSVMLSRDASELMLKCDRDRGREVRRMGCEGEESGDVWNKVRNVKIQWYRGGIARVYLWRGCNW